MDTPQSAPPGLLGSKSDLQVDLNLAELNPGMAAAQPPAHTFDIDSPFTLPPSSQNPTQSLTNESKSTSQIVSVPSKPDIAAQEVNSTGAQAQITSPTGSPPPASIATSQPEIPSVDAIFREFLYRCCRDTLFWIEAERFRQNPTQQKATFILRTFFTENAEFCLCREDFPPQLQILFSKQRPQMPTQLLIEAQDQMKSRLISSMAPSFTQSAMLTKFHTNPEISGQEIMHPSFGGSLARFLAQRPQSVIIPTNPGSSPLSTPTLNQTSNPSLTGVQPPTQTASLTTPLQSPAQTPTVSIPHSTTQGTTQGTSSLTPLQSTTQTPSLSTLQSSAEIRSLSPPQRAPQSPTQTSPQTSPQISSPGDSSQIVNDVRPSRNRAGHVFNAGEAQPSISPPETRSVSPTSSGPWIPQRSGTSPPAEAKEPQTQLPSLQIPQPSPNSQKSPTLSPNNPASNYVSSLSPSSSNSSQPSSVRLTREADLSRRPSRGSLVDGTLTSSQVTKIATPVVATKPGASPSSRVNVVGMVRDKVGQAKREKERKEREKYFEPVVNGWMIIENPSLDDCIHDSQMMLLFYDFLRTIHAEENLACWIEMELYKASTASRESRKNHGIDILVKYFEPSSSSLINVEGVNYKEILKLLNERPSRDVFDSAQHSLWDQLAIQCYSRFKDTEMVKRLYDEPTIKGKKKELTKMAQKLARSSNENAAFLPKLEEFSRFRAGFVPLVPTVSEKEFQLEDVLYYSDLLIAFREYLNTLPNPTEYLDILNFWFEVEVWKLSPKETQKDAAIQIFTDYLLPKPNGSARISILGLDLKEMDAEIRERPDKNTFTRIQVHCWRRLKLEQFGNFENSETLTKFFEGNLPMRQNIPIVKHCEALNEMRTKNMNDAQFKANLAKVTGKVRLKKQEVQGLAFDLDHMLADKEYVAILCEFLDKRQARENLAFWVEAEYWKCLMTPGDRAFTAGKIWDRFFSDKADIHINVDVSDKSALASALKDPSNLPDNLFVACQDQIYALLAFDLIPKFITSEQGSKMLKIARKRPPVQNPVSIRTGGTNLIRELRSWVSPSTNIL